MEDHDRSDNIGEEILGKQPDAIFKDAAASNFNNLRTEILMKKADLVIALFGEKYKQWNTAMDASAAVAYGKPLILIRQEEHHHALKEFHVKHTLLSKQSTKRYKATSLYIRMRVLSSFSNRRKYIYIKYGYRRICRIYSKADIISKIDISVTKFTKPLHYLNTSSTIFLIYIVSKHSTPNRRITHDLMSERIKKSTPFVVMENTNWRKPVYETNGLNLWYGTTHALKNIDLSINEKEVTAIIGPSGCGKSTYLKTLNRMVEMVPDVSISGNVTFQRKKYSWQGNAC